MTMGSKFQNSTPNPQYPGLFDVDPQTLFDSISAKKDELFVMDVRREDEWNGELGRIPSAHHMRLDTVPTRLDEIPKDKTIVVVCLAGGRSTNAAAFLMENGFQDVYNVKGGMLLWNQCGLQVEK